MNDSVNLQINGRIVLQLGEALISDEIMALSELIKNAYDADSRYVNIIVDTACEDPVIKVIDDGCGMDQNTIKNGFLKIGTDIKAHQKVSKKYKRITQGNKGIGRLSLNKLSKHVNVITVPESIENTGCTCFSIDWQKFADASTVSEVKIELTESDLFYKKYFAGRIDNKHGTVLELTKINNIDLWNEKDTVKRIKDEIIALIDPHVDNEKSFNIFMNINGEQVDFSELNFAVIENKANVKSAFWFHNNAVEIDIIRDKAYINDRIDKEIKRLNISSDEFDIVLDKEKLYERFSKRSYYIDLDNISKDYPMLEDSFIKDEKSKYMPGEFYGKIYAFDYNAADLTKVEKNMIEVMSGVNLYRNGFRIFPYGKGNDWFNFTKYSQTIKSNIYKMHTVSGYVKIDGEENLNRLKEMTNRRGLIEDNYGSNFLLLIKSVISRQLVEDDIKLRKELSVDVKRINELNDSGSTYDVFNDKTFVITRKIKNPQNIKEEMMKKANQISEDEYAEVSKNEILEMAQGINNASLSAERVIQEVRSKEAMLDELMGVIGSALIAEKFAHEVLRNTNYIKKNTQIILGYSDETVLEKFRNKVSIIFSKAKYLDKLASTLDKNSYSRRKETTNFELFSFLRMYIFESFSEIFTENNVRLIIEDNTFYVNGSKEEILIAFENLIVNSLDWFEINNVNDRIITISINSESNTVEYYDNGNGIHKDVENTLFDPFITLKPLSSKGRGIGLYIVKTLLQENKAYIFLSEEKNDLGNRYKFIIDFSMEE